jgi:mannose-6-phosphate isomerase-like protein (cupin superfamily)
MTMTIRRLYASAGTLIVMGCAAIVALAIASDLRAQAQPSIPKDPVQLPNHRYDLPVTVLTAAQIDAHKQRMLAAKDDDVPMNMVKAGGSSEQHQVGISLVMRAKGQSNPNFAVHDDVAEVYHVLEGKGTMLVGGRIVDWQRRPTSAGNGMGSGGTKSDGARQIQIAKGDVVIIPAGTPHRWLMADEFTLYTVVRLDPDGVTPLEDYKEGAGR